MTRTLVEPHIRVPLCSLCMLCALGVSQVRAQSNPRAAMPERPTVATHAFTVAPGYLELETGAERDANRDGTVAWSTPTVLKIGLASRAQAGLFASLVGPPGARTSIGDLAAGIKYRPADDLQIVGALGVLPIVKFPTGDDAHGTRTTDVSVIVISSHKFGDAALDVNVGYTRRSGDGSRAPKDATGWTVSGGLPLGGDAGLALEVFGYPRTTGAAGAPSSIALLGGPTWQLGESTVIDAGVIVRLQGPQANAVYAGVTRNLGRW